MIHFPNVRYITSTYASDKCKVPSSYASCINFYYATRTHEKYHMYYFPNLHIFSCILYYCRFTVYILTRTLYDSSLRSWDLIFFLLDCLF